MDLNDLRQLLIYVQHLISFMGGLVILTGILIAVYHYLLLYAKRKNKKHLLTINNIRLNLAKTLLLGLEFIIAADLIGTTTTPDYYSLGILAVIVLVRTFLSFSLNRELISLSKEQNV